MRQGLITKRTKWSLTIDLETIAKPRKPKPEVFAVLLITELGSELAGPC